MTNPRRNLRPPSGVAGHHLTAAIGGILTPAAHAAATFAAGRCAAMLPVCLDAIFANLTPPQRSQLATTITADLAAAAARNHPTPETPTRTEGKDRDQH